MRSISAAAMSVRGARTTQRRCSGVLDEGDVEALLGCARQGLDAHRVQTGHGGAGQRGEEGGAAVHEATVCRAPRNVGEEPPGVRP